MKLRDRYSNWFRGLPLLAAAALLTAIPRSIAAQNPTSAQSSRPAVRPQPAPSAAGNPTSAGLEMRGAQPAAVTLKNGTLTIEANNSDLDQILRDVSRESGMVIEGQVKNTRIYGNYGPRKPDEILTELLAGLGYNIIMIGTSREGAPRELKLTSRTGGPTPPAPSRASAPQQEEEPRLGPGAVAHPPPAQLDDPQMRRQVNLQRLQQMHDAQEKEKENEHR